MTFTLPRIYPITDTGISGLSHTQQVVRLISGGADFIQLREKAAPSSEFYRSAVDVVRYARELNARVIVNDRADIALLTGAAGVHLGQEDMPPAAARALLGDEAVIGLSTHSVEQARAAIEQPVDYIAIGPIFSTTTKDRSSPVVGLDGLRKVRSAVGSFPLVAIGGIDAGSVVDVLRAGADSAAMVAALIGEPETIAEIMAALIELTSSID